MPTVGSYKIRAAVNLSALAGVMAAGFILGESSAEGPAVNEERGNPDRSSTFGVACGYFFPGFNRLFGFFKVGLAFTSANSRVLSSFHLRW